MSKIGSVFAKAAWRKTHRSPCNNVCPKSAFVEGLMAIRDSKIPGGSILIYSASDWQAFLASVNDGKLDDHSAADGSSYVGLSGRTARWQTFSSALSDWPRTVRLCVILLVASIPLAIGSFCLRSVGAAAMHKSETCSVSRITQQPRDLAQVRQGLTLGPRSAVWR
jgi:Domain of unknown function (DUF397)